MEQETTGQKIKRIRKEKKLTQKELGKLCGMKESQIGNYENGLRNPKLPTLKKIADALEVDIPAILGNIVYNDYDSKELNFIFKSYREKSDNDFYRVLNERGIKFISEAIYELLKRDNKYPQIINDTNGLNIFTSTNLESYQTLSNEELKEIQNKLLDHLDLLLIQALKDKEVIKRPKEKNEPVNIDSIIDDIKFD